MAYNSIELCQRMSVDLDKRETSARKWGQIMVDVADAGVSLPLESKSIGTGLVRMTRNDIMPETEYQQLADNLRSWKEFVSTSLINNDTGGSFEFSYVVPRRVNNSLIITRVASTSEAPRFIHTEATVLRLTHQQYNLRTLNRVACLDVEDYGGRQTEIEDFFTRTHECADLFRQIHQNQCSGFGKITLPQRLIYSYDLYLLNRLKNRGDKIPIDIFRSLSSRVVNAEKLKKVRPVLSHIDPGPRNFILDKDGKLRMVDFEHSSGCGVYWDIERMASQLPSTPASMFRSDYYSDIREFDESIASLTELIVIAIDATALNKYTVEQKSAMFESIRSKL